MRRFGVWALIVTVVFNGVSVCPCHADNPVDCLLYPLYDFGDGISLYDADYYSDRTCVGGTCTCTGGPTEEYLYEASNNSTPETCPNCLADGSGSVTFAKSEKLEMTAIQIPLLKGKEHALKNALSEPIAFGANLRNYKYTDAEGTKHDVDPKQGYQVLLSSWVKVQAKDGTYIPVKLHALEFDYRRTGLPAEGYKGSSRKRTSKIGFEFNKMPSPEIDAAAPKLVPTQITGYKNTGYVKSDAESGNFLVVTYKPLF